jgi:two-component system, cell cycle sensor histidine kinase and response regulator CckA
LESEQTKPERELIFGSGNILMVDDEESIRKYMDAFLTELGYSVTCCSSGIQAEKVFDKNHDSIDLVILDIMMPNLDGKETFLRMKKIDPDMHAIIISGYDDQIINAQEAKLLGIIDCIQKPFDEQYLSKRIAEITTS